MRIFLWVFLLTGCGSSYLADVVFLDVGQGDGALVRFADGRSVLVDAGDGSGALVRELARFGVLAPTAVVLSHSDKDHAFGLVGILEAMRVGGVYWHAGESRTPRPIVTALEGMARIHHVPIHRVVAPRSLGFGPRSSMELSPVSTGESQNGLQLGADLRVGRCRFVFLGDMTEVGERWWLSRHQGAATVLKVSHHGSRTSSAPELLRSLRPRWSVVSCGAANRYGHPVPEVMERFRKERLELLRTDFHGAIRFRVRDDGWVRCEMADGECGEWRCRE